jgi:hypothetical protein
MIVVGGDAEGLTGPGFEHGERAEHGLVAEAPDNLDDEYPEGHDIFLDSEQEEEAPAAAEGPQPPDARKQQRYSTVFTELQLQEMEEFFQRVQYPYVFAR